ncbi:hypothetical protein [Bacillus litorisediminis]|uniref:hypothetical protein n=1 Tax=Bacillus litorisediminis TaxID=2922713 RepID=UPI001FAD1FF2|nr:hypothetical protein [Bacillus litorisediminis]
MKKIYVSILAILALLLVISTVFLINQDSQAKSYSNRHEHDDQVESVNRMVDKIHKVNFLDELESNLKKEGYTSQFRLFVYSEEKKDIEVVLSTNTKTVDNDRILDIVNATAKENDLGTFNIKIIQ